MVLGETDQGQKRAHAALGARPDVTVGYLSRPRMVSRYANYPRTSSETPPRTVAVRLLVLLIFWCSLPPKARQQPARTDTGREMEAADWASLSNEELLERRISKLGLFVIDHSSVDSESDPGGTTCNVINSGFAFVHTIASRFVSKNRSTTMALSWFAVRPHRRAALRLTIADPVSTAVQERSGKTTLLP